MSCSGMLQACRTPAAASLSAAGLAGECTSSASEPRSRRRQVDAATPAVSKEHPGSQWPLKARLQLRRMAGSGELTLGRSIHFIRRKQR
jgi:hypothetical protein